MSKFFIPPESIKNGLAQISGPEAHHILDVMRLKTGDEISAFDGQGQVYSGKILSISGKRIKLAVTPLDSPLAQSRLQVVLVQSLPKKNKMEAIIEKCTELGISEIIPTQTARSIVRLDRERSSRRLLRWRRIAQEAAKQCGRVHLPQIGALSSLDQALSAVADCDLKLLFSLNSNAARLKDVVDKHRQARRIALLIGPEGDFTPQEVALAQKRGCLTASLGPNVLKADTAAITALGNISFALEP